MPLRPVKPGTRITLTDDAALDDREPSGEEAARRVVAAV